MVTARSSDIAHRGVAICNPVSSAALDRMVEYARMAPDGTALDVGCGKGEFLLRLAARYGCRGHGVDMNAHRVAIANQQADAHGLLGKVRFDQQDVREGFDHAGPFELTACIGSTHALGGLEPTLETLSAWTAPGGWVVVGEGHWAREPDPAYLQAIGSTRYELGRDGWVEHAARVAGLDPVQRWTATRQDWDNYEDTLLSNMESYVASAPEDEEAPAMLADHRSFHEAQVRWGRDTMGFAIYLLRKREGTGRRAGALG